MKLSYLRSISVSGFRVFPEGGAHFTLEGPGLTILVGQNGLGKSSLMEAIEWSLTGEVQRLERLKYEVVRKENVQAYYARRSEGKIAGAIDVTLTFDVGSIRHKLRRKSEQQSRPDRFKVSVEPTAEDIQTVLVNENWSVSPERLSAYLHNTHLLVQSAGSRWASLDPKERWDRIEGPAGIGRLESIRSHLGKSTDNGFAKLLDASQQRLFDAQARLTDWDELLARVATNLLKIGRPGRTSREALKQKSDELVSELLSLFADLPRRTGVELGSNMRGAESAGELIERLQRGLAGHQSAVDAAAQIPPAVQRILQDVLELDSEILKQEEANRFTEQQIQALDLRLDQIKVDATALRSRAAGARASVNRLQQLRAAWQDLPRIRSRLVAHGGLIEQLTREIGIARDQLAKHRAGAEAAETAQRKASEILQRIKEYRTLHARLKDWLARSSSTNAQRLELENLKAEAISCQDTISRSRQMLDSALRAERAARARLAKVEKQRNELSRLVTAIVGHITAEDCFCPVCHTSFRTGELLQKAVSGVMESDPVMAQAQEDVRTSAAEAHKAAETLARAEEAANVLNDRFEGLSRSVIAHSSDLELLRAREPLRSLTYETGSMLAERLDSLRAADEVEFEQLGRTVAELELLRSELAHADSACKDLENAIHREQRAADDARAQLVTTESLLAGAVDELETWRLDANKADLDVATAMRAADYLESIEQEAGRRARQTTKELEDQKDVLRVGDLRLGNLREKRRSDEDHLVVLKNSWAEAGLVGDCTDANLELGRNSLSKRKERLAELRSLDRWLLSEWSEIEALDRNEGDNVRIQETLTRSGHASEAEHTAALTADVVSATEKLERTERAHKLFRRLADRLRTEAKDYAQNVMRPLKDVANRFHLALSPFPERGLALGVRATLNAPTSLYLNVQPHRDQPNSDELAAHLLLSEGQLSEASLSFLFAMSTVYRWSRWRALLLDDPLQQNDIVHVSAFIDVVRRMIVDDAYQIVVSTHDSEVADYMARKARSGGVPCTIHRFVNPGRAESSVR